MSKKKLYTYTCEKCEVQYTSEYPFDRVCLNCRDKQSSSFDHQEDLLTGAWIEESGEIDPKVFQELKTPHKENSNK